MAKDLDKIFGENQIDNTDNGKLDVGDEVVGEVFASENTSDKTATDNYFAEIFGEDIEQNVADEDFDPNAVWVRDENGVLIKKEDEERDEKTTEEVEEPSEDIDEAAELLGGFNDKKGKKNKKTPSKSIPKKDVKRDVFVSEFSENDEVPCSSVRKEDVADAISNETEYVDETVETSVSEARGRSIKKSVKEMTDQEIRELTPDQISSLSASEKKELFDRFDDSKALERKEQITGIPDIIRDNKLYEQETTEHREPLGVLDNKDYSFYKGELRENAHSSDTPVEHLETPISEYAEDSFADNKITQKQPSDAISYINPTPDDMQSKAEVPKSPLFVDDTAQFVGEAINVSESRTEQNRAIPFDDGINNSDNRLDEQPTPTSYSVIEQKTVEKEDSLVVLYNDAEQDRQRSTDSLKPFSPDAFVEDVRKYTGGYALEMQDNGDSFVFTTPSNDTYILDKETGSVLGVDNGSVLGQIIGKAYTQYEPAQTNANKLAETYIPIEPTKKDSWSSDELVKTLSKKYGETSVSVDSDKHTVISVNADCENGFTIKLDKTHSPVNIGIRAATNKSLVEEAKNDILQYNETVIANDNAVYLHQKIAYDNYMKKHNTETVSSPIYSTMTGFNPNGKTVVVGNGYNIPFASNKTAQAGVNSANPHRSNVMPSIVMSTKYGITNVFNREVLPSSEKASKYVADTYSRILDFQEKKRTNPNYIDANLQKTIITHSKDPNVFPFYDERLNNTDSGRKTQNTIIPPVPVEKQEERYNEYRSEYDEQNNVVPDTNKNTDNETGESEQNNNDNNPSPTPDRKRREGENSNADDGPVPEVDVYDFYSTNVVYKSKTAMTMFYRKLERPAINVVKGTVLNNDVMQGTREVGKYAKMPFFIGTNLAAQNIWRQTNITKALRTQSNASKIIVNQAWNSGISFKLSRVCSYSDYLAMGRMINRRGRKLGFKNLCNSSYGEIQIMLNTLRHSTIVVNGKTIDLATAKSIYRHLGNRAPQEVVDMVQSASLLNTALSFAELTDGLGGQVLQQMLDKGIIGSKDGYDLTKTRDIMKLQSLLRKYAESNGYGFLWNMSKKQLHKWIKDNASDNFKWVAEILLALKGLEAKSHHLDRLKFSRLFSVIQFIRNFAGNNELVQGAMMFYRAYTSTIMAIKATTRFVSLARRTFRHIFGAIGRRVVRSRPYRWYKTQVTDLYNISKTKTKVEAAKKTAKVVPRKLKSTKIGRFTQKVNRKLRQGFTRVKTFRSTLASKGQATKNVIKKAFVKPKWMQATGKTLGKIFLGAVLGVAIFVITTSLLNFLMQLVLGLYKYMSVFFNDEDIYKKSVAKVYEKLEEQDEAFYEDICAAGTSSNLGKTGYFDLNAGVTQMEDCYGFNLYSITSVGDPSAVDGSLNKLGYVYHLYDKIFDGTVRPSSVQGINEIPFQSNAVELLSMANVICADEAPYKDIVVQKYNNKNSTKTLSAKELLQDLCLDGKNFRDAESSNSYTLWTATHGFYTYAGDLYTCATGDEEHTYSCGEYKATTNSRNDYKTVSLTAVPSTQLLYSYHNNNSEFLKLKGGLYGDASGETRTTTVNGTTYQTGCKKHTTQSTQYKFTKTYYCGCYHENKYGVLYKCTEANKNHSGIGHSKTVYKILDDNANLCQEQICVWENESVTVQNVTECTNMASFCNFTDIYNTQKSGTSALQKNIAWNVTNYNNTKLKSGGTVVDGWYFNGWVYVSSDYFDDDADQMKALLKQKCSDLQYTVQSIQYSGITLYLHIFYCPGHSTCSETIHTSSASQYQKVKVNMTWKVVDASNSAVSYNFNVYLRRNCGGHKVENKTITVSLPQRFECVGYCDGNHTVRYCHGHFNNCVDGYVVKSTNNQFSFYCTNTECSLYHKRIDNATDNECEECGLKGLPCYQDGLDTGSVFYADMMYGPSSLGLLPHWGTKYPNDPTNFISNGWYHKDKMVTRQTLALAKMGLNWYLNYEITPKRVYTGGLTAGQIEYFYNITKLDNASESFDNRELRKNLMSTALSSVGNIPYYVGQLGTGGTPSTIGMADNDFGSTVVGDLRGRTLKGLNNTAWVVWAYDTAINNTSVALNSVYRGGTNGYNKFNKKTIQPGDVVVTSVVNKVPKTFGIYLGNDPNDNNSYCIIEMCDDPTNNVAIRYVKSSAIEGYIPISQFSTVFKTAVVA